MPVLGATLSKVIGTVRVVVAPRCVEARDSDVGAPVRTRLGNAHATTTTSQVF